MINLIRIGMAWLILFVVSALPARAELACPPESPRLLEIVYTYKTLAPWEPRQRVLRTGAQLCARGEMTVVSSVPENASGESTAPAEEPFPLQLTVAKGQASDTDLKALRSLFGQHRIGVQRDCYWQDVTFQALITWFGKEGRSHSFTVSPYEPSLPVCSAGVRAIVEGYFQLQQQAAYPDRLVLGPA